MDEEAGQSGLEETARRLRADLESRTPSVPAEIVWAYQDPTVRESIARRLAAGERLVSRHVLMPDLVLQLHRVYFVFQPAHGPDEAHPGLLVQLREDFQLQEVIDPVLLHESRVRDTAVNEGAFPLAISRPIRSEGMRTDRALSQFEDFVRREGLEPAFARLLSDGGGFGGTGNFSSGTCVQTWNETPVLKNPGAPTKVHSIDVDYVEDDIDVLQ